MSEHLRVLRQIGAVDVRRHGRLRLYQVNGRALKPIHDWVSRYEEAWEAPASSPTPCSAISGRRRRGDGSNV